MMNPSHPIPRHRRWAVRLILLVACIGTVATSQPQSADVFAEYEGPPVSLTTDAPLTTRHFMLRVFSKDPFSESVEITLDADVTARWRPADPSSTVKPRLLARLSMPVDGASNPGLTTTLVLEPSGQPGTGRTSRTMVYPGCTPERPCEWNILIELELQPNSTAGAVDVDWKVKATAHVLGSSELPKGFTVQLSEN